MAERKKPSAPTMSAAEVDRANREWESIPVPIRIARSRTLNVLHCLTWRRKIKKGPVVLDDGTVFTVEFMTFLLRRNQKQLLKLRIWRSTGQYPPSDD